MREAGPLVYLDKWSVYGVARYKEVHAVLNDPATFCSSRGVGLSDFSKEKPWRPPSIILEADPPAHTRTRAVLSRVLSPAVMKQIRDRFATAAEAKVDELIARRSFDAIADLAEAYPLSVFPDAMGLKQDGRENLLPYAGLVFNAFGPPNQLRQDAIERSRTASGLCRSSNASVKISRPAVSGPASMTGSTPEKSPRPRRRCWCARCSRPASTPPSTASALRSTAWRVFRRNWRGCAAIRRSRATPSRKRSGFESPVQTFFRTTTRDVDIGGLRIAEGEKVLMFLASANRDPRRWENPERYDITRRTSGHVGFGSASTCVSASWSRASRAR